MELCEITRLQAQVCVGGGIGAVLGAVHFWLMHTGKLPVGELMPHLCCPLSTSVRAIAMCVELLRGTGTGAGTKRASCVV